MTRRQRLSETQLAEVFDPPTEQRELVRHYTLSETDLAAIACCRGDHNRLGHAVMRCHLRYPGRALRVGERPPAALLGFIAEQGRRRPFRAGVTRMGGDRPVADSEGAGFARPCA